MSILWVVLIIVTVSIGLFGIFMRPTNQEDKADPEEESYSEKLVRWRKEAEEEEKKRFMDSIREPVFSFLKVFKENPKRFKLKCTNKPTQNPKDVVVDTLIDLSGVREYSLTDLETGEEFQFSYYRTRGYKGQLPIAMRSHEWLEGNEVTYLYREIKKYYAERASRKDLITYKRRDRVLSKERDRLMEVYGGESEGCNNQAQP